jgi:hypothetical protein
MPFPISWDLSPDEKRVPPAKLATGFVFSPYLGTFSVSGNIRKNDCFSRAYVSFPHILGPFPISWDLWKKLSFFQYLDSPHILGPFPISWDLSPHILGPFTPYLGTFHPISWDLWMEKSNSDANLQAHKTLKTLKTFKTTTGHLSSFSRALEKKEKQQQHHATLIP